MLTCGYDFDSNDSYYESPEYWSIAKGQYVCCSCSKSIKVGDELGIF